MYRHFTKAVALIATGMLFSAAAPAFAQPVNLVTNGDFETSSGVGQLANGLSTTAGWTSHTVTDGSANTGTAGFNFIVDGSADSTGFPSVNSASANTNIFVWGPNGSSSHFSDNGFTDNGNGFFLGSDASYAVAAVTQTINGLIAGRTYAINFDWAQAQLTDNSAATTSGWNVSLGNQTVSTGTPILEGRGFSGWNTFSDTFIATAATETLSFLASGSPSGGLPFVLADNISLTEATPATPPLAPPSSVPEPSTSAMLLCGIALLGCTVSSQRKNKTQ